ncbi:MAG: indole-3-glycerol phosphate synthase TrpC [Candidatus Omnitrophica bacterium]|nr:indole-3-glycerol phosphate synthase TrpC [Candidatus Omnitrophota bacterium]
MKKKDALKEIIAKKKERLSVLKCEVPEEVMKVRAREAASPRLFIESLIKPKTISLIAEIKRASPSAGMIRENFDHREIACLYQEAGAAALSVLTEEDFFMGNPAFIAEVKSAVSLPVLRKDFIFEPYQVYESRALGADAILLIADVLSKDALTDLTGIADDLGMDCLVEAHGEKELKKVLSLKGPVITGINNRDLRTLEVDFKTTERLFPLIPKNKPVVVESGIKSAQDVLFLRILGVSAVLIGQAFMGASDIRAKVEDIMGW